MPGLPGRESSAWLREVLGSGGSDAMTIGNKLYQGFGLILGILALLLVVDLASIWKARSASNEALIIEDLEIA